MKTDLVPQNVAMKVDRPKKNDYQPTFLDAAELQKVFEAVKGSKLELPVLVAAFYGLRRGEVCGLRWDAIDFERGTITIKHTVTSTQLSGKKQIIAQDSAKTKSSIVNDCEFLEKDSIILLEQIRTLDKQRLQEYIGTFDRRLMLSVDKSLAISIGLEIKPASDEGRVL